MTGHQEPLTFNLSSSPENRRSVRLFLTAIALAFRWPMSTTNLLPRVMPVPTRCRCNRAGHEEANLLLNQNGPILPEKLLQFHFAGQGNWHPQLLVFAVPVMHQGPADEPDENTRTRQLPHLPGLKRFQSDVSFFQHGPILGRNRHDSNANRRKSSHANR